MAGGEARESSAAGVVCAAAARKPNSVSSASESGIFSVALSVGLLRPAVSGHRARILKGRILSSDFPHPDCSGRDHLSDRRRIYYTLDDLSGSFLLSSIFYPLSSMPTAAQPD